MSAENQITSTVKLPFSFAVGATATRFYKALRDEKTIYGTRCNGCNRVAVPARSFCDRCHQSMDNWVALPDTGILQGWSERNDHGDQNSEQGFIALIKLEGADNLLLHKLGNVDPSEIVTGMEVAAVWREERTGTLADIAYFGPVARAERDGAN